jgi:YIF1
VPGANTPFANFATSYLSNNIGAAEGFVSSRLNSWVPVESLRYYFNVNNSYVLNKIGRILFPFGPRSRVGGGTLCLLAYSCVLPSLIF